MIQALLLDTNGIVSVINEKDIIDCFRIIWQWIEWNLKIPKASPIMSKLADIIV